MVYLYIFKESDNKIIKDYWYWNVVKSEIIWRRILEEFDL